MKDNGRTVSGRAGVLVVLCLFAAGCAREVVITRISPPPPRQPVKDYGRRLPPGAASLRKITDPSRLPDFRTAYNVNRADLAAAVDRSIHYFTFPSSQDYFPFQDISHTRAVQSLEAFREILQSATSKEEFHRRIIAKFDVYESVGWDNQGTVLFTGYYTPIFDARLEPDETFKWPLYKLPPDQVKGKNGACLGRRTADGNLAPYYSRAEIEAGALKGHELVYLKDRFEAYVCTVEGSAKLRLADGRLVGIAYHGNNGKAYTSIGRQLVADGLLRSEELSLHRLIRLFQEHPEQMSNYLPRNERYVFFRRSDAPPTGCLGRPVTPFCSIATGKATETDSDTYPRGSLAFVDTRMPRISATGTALQAPFRRFMLDQDTGGAIRAAGCADIYVGIGERAGRIAGGTLAEGRFYYLFSKEDGP
jgi:membrane-bound lytic murein transglycosylase A